jgi:hypothetical protein
MMNGIYVYLIHYISNDTNLINFKTITEYVYKKYRYSNKEANTNYTQNIDYKYFA